MISADHKLMIMSIHSSIIFWHLPESGPLYTRRPRCHFPDCLAISSTINRIMHCWCIVCDWCWGLDRLYAAWPIVVCILKCLCGLVCVVIGYFCYTAFAILTVTRIYCSQLYVMGQLTGVWKGSLRWYAGQVHCEWVVTCSMRSHLGQKYILHAYIHTYFTCTYIYNGTEHLHTHSYSVMYMRVRMHKRASRACIDIKVSMYTL